MEQQVLLDLEDLLVLQVQLVPQVLQVLLDQVLPEQLVQKEIKAIKV